MKSKFRKALLIILIVFGLYNLIWGLYVTNKFTPYKEALGGVTYLETEEYTYLVKTPGYLSFTGNLAVTENAKSETDSTGIIIWVYFGDKFDVAFNVSETTVDSDNLSTNTNVYGIMLDSSKAPDFSVDGVYELYTEHRDLFDSKESDKNKLYEAAYEKWGILGE